MQNFKARKDYFLANSIDNTAFGYDSEDEYYFECLLSELRELGLVDNWKYQPKPFTLSENVKGIKKKVKSFKTKPDEIVDTEYIIFQDKIYTADYFIVFTPKGKDVLYSDVKNAFCNTPFKANKKGDSYFCVIDIKGGFVQHNMDRELSLIQKWVYQRTGIYVQMIQCFGKRNAKKQYVGNFFDTVYTPNNYLVRPGVRGGLLKVKCNGKTKNEFLKELKDGIYKRDKLATISD